MSLCASSLFCSFVFQHPDRSGQVTPRTKFAFERFFSELVKAVVVASICLYQHNRNRAQSERTWTTGAMSTWCLTFTALQRMTSAAYQLLLNMRIIAVAVLSVVVLGKSFNKSEWCAMALLTVGAMQYRGLPFESHRRYL